MDSSGSQVGQKREHTVVDVYDEHPGEHHEVDHLSASPVYRTFVVRCWLQDSTDPAWRFSLLEVGSSRPRRVFAHLDDLVTFLQGALDATEADRRAGFDRLVEVFQRASCNTDYRQALIADPVGVLAAAGLEVPAGVTYQIVENTRECIHIVLPPLASDAELGGEPLEARATKSPLLCAAGPGRANLIALIPGCDLAV